jgi:hypothetical protein
MMNDRRGPGQAREDEVGLCAACAHARVIESARGSRFYLCQLSFVDPRYPRYPPLPVVQCNGYIKERMKEEG